MELRLYDTLTRDKRTFVPLDPDHVRMYVCGPTVYDFAHIGNARPAIVFDVLFRLLRHVYGADHVTYVRNITDVDDKINERAARDFPALPLNEAIRKVTEGTERQFHDDVDALGCLRPTVEPRATDHIAEMRAIIEKLVAGGFAYVAEDHVLFSPQAMNAANSVLPRYGALANRSLDEMIAGARVDVAPYKRDATDFVLWKPSKPGEPSWPSPAGIKAEGRPGWHIECSAMAWKHLGQQFDIHGGGIDLVFPHHENELAQSCCAFHENRMANIWMHNGFLQVEGEKMSKSLGNFVTIRELLADWPGEVLRLNMLKTHYRSPIDWTLAGLHASALELDGWRTFTRYSDASKGEVSGAVLAALTDDLNTSLALTEIRKLVEACRTSADPWSKPSCDLLATSLFLGIDPG
ncbi:cysteine--tRNA ligase, partial [Bradyrhizobium sp.]|uniref:cysteine--tRNA ligase n=1 Tax=Bradyrhizobium sp. TaxID=376 RepID=UPI003C314810